MLAYVASKNSSSSSVSMMSSLSCMCRDIFWCPPGVAVAVAGDCTVAVDTPLPLPSTSSGVEMIVIGAGRCDGAK